MKEDIVSYELAVLAKKKGFDLIEPCTCGGYPDCICDIVRQDIKYIYKPTHGLLQKWLGNKHGLYAYIDYSKEDVVIVVRNNIDNNELLRMAVNEFMSKSTIPEILDELLMKALNLII